MRTMTKELASVDEIDWTTEITALLDDSDVKPDGFGLYLNFMLPYNMDKDGVIDEDKPYIDITEDVAGDESQTRFLIEALAAKNGMQLQNAFIRDPHSEEVAGYHYGLFYIGKDIVGKFVELRHDVEIEMSRFHELGKMPVLPLMQFTLLAEKPPVEEVGDVAEGDEELF